MTQGVKKTRQAGLGVTTGTMFIAWTLGLVGVVMLILGGATAAALVILAAAILQAGAMIAEAIYRSRS
ncbi:hypothetical protein [Glutamicibacter arilaitensis]|uniref:hypothetical protein n=1 Tax=Glutamicibacter arilaitensis TaxID=256701 RepID=UPI003F90FF2F